MKKISGFALINTVDNKVFSYTFSETNETGDIIRNNIRKSVAIKDTDEEVLKAIETIQAFILSKE